MQFEDDNLSQAEAAAEKLIDSLPTSRGASRSIVQPWLQDDYEDPHTWMEQDDGGEDEERIMMMQEKPFTETIDTVMMVEEDDDDYQNDENMEENTTVATTPIDPSSPPKRRILQRADTPVTSNTKKQKKSIVLQLHTSTHIASIPQFLHEYGFYHAVVRDWRRTKNDENFLQSLHTLCWRRPESTLEGNFWLLLLHLHQHTGSLWNVSTQSTNAETVYNEIATAITTQLAPQIHRSPNTILQELPKTCPALTRHRAVLDWLEACFKHILPSTIQPQSSQPPSMATSEDTNILPKMEPELFFHNALALYMAGRLDEARKLAGGPWAALWGGGQPHSGTTGNPNRAVWRVLIRSLASQHQYSDACNTLLALLGTDLNQAFAAERSIDTWEKCLYAVVRCSWDRWEDFTLHEHNVHRRMSRPPYPGTQWEEEEREQLHVTQTLRTVGIEQAVEIVAASPNSCLEGPLDVVRQWTGQVLVGKEIKTLTTIAPALEELWTSPERMRFGVHWGIYLVHSLSEPSDEVVEWKNKLVVEYLRFLADYEDLWSLMIVYAAFLPEHILKEVLPELLALIDDPGHRKDILNQMDEFLVSSPHIVTDLLLLTVSCVINDDEDSDEELDARKMNSILWLCQNPSHVGDAMVATNALLRQFLLHDKPQLATELIDSVVPSDLDQQVLALAEESDVFVHYSYSEYTALSEYLHAAQCWESFQRTIGQPPQWEDAPTYNMARLTAKEKEIAAENQMRFKVQTIQASLEKLLESTEEVLVRFRRVLEHQGGFLQTVEAEVAEDGRRVDQLNQLRKLLLPSVIERYHKACTMTGGALEHVLNVATEWLGLQTVAETVQKLDEGRKEDEDNLLTPLFWAQKANELYKDIVADDAFAISSALEPQEALRVTQRGREAALLVGEWSRCSISAEILEELQE